MTIGVIGGHLSPALSFIDAISAEDKVIFYGRQFAMERDTTPSLEYKTITKKDIPFISITTGKVSRSLSFSGFVSLLKIPKGFFQARRALFSNNVDVVVGFGGYLSVPVCLAAKTLGIPVVIHEQTLGAGLANKLISRFADKVCLSWEESKKYFPKNKSIVTGNPLKHFPPSDFPFTLPHDKRPLLYVTGGSTGAHAINVLIEQALPMLLEKYTIVHQTGDAKEFGDFNRLTSLRSTLPPSQQDHYLLTTFVSPLDVGAIFVKADLVISRSGINTVTELLYFGKPCLLIPLPYGQKNEQMTNAEFIQKVGLAEIAPQYTTTPELLNNKIEQMIAKKDSYISHAKKAGELVNPNAAEKIYEIVTYVVTQTSS